MARDWIFAYYPQRGSWPHELAYGFGAAAAGRAACDTGKPGAVSRPGRGVGGARRAPENRPACGDRHRRGRRHGGVHRIEQLFKKAEADRKYARDLKKELDRWNLFELYENRFLDLFDDDRKKGGNT